MSVLLEMHIVHLKAAGSSPNTIKDRRRLLTAADRQLPYGIDTATTNELEAFLAEPSWAAWTRATYARHICAFYRWAAGGHEPYISFDPAADLTMPRSPEAVPHPATDEQVRTALARSDNRWQRAISFASYAGLRAAEIGAMKREFVHADHFTVRGKGNRTVALPTHPEIWRLVEPLPPGLLFPNRSGGPSNMTALAGYHFQQIRMPGLHMHMFRHWYAVSLLKAGVDIRMVQSLMRHKSLVTTAAYLQIVDGQRRLAVNTLPVLHSSPLQEAA